VLEFLQLAQFGFICMWISADNSIYIFF
jgi:hypothetical protein